MSSGGKWPTKWLAARAKATAEEEPSLRSYLGLDDDSLDQLGQEASLAAQRPAPPAVRPAPAQPSSATVFTAPPAAREIMAVPDVPKAMPLAMPPSMAAAPSPGPRRAEQSDRAAAQRSRMRAVIGDELRAPALLCEFAGCSARYTYSDALGERQLRDLALAAGWQYDLIGRLACPSCVRHDQTFWSPRPQALTRRGE